MGCTIRNGRYAGKLRVIRLFRHRYSNAFAFADCERGHSAPQGLTTTLAAALLALGLTSCQQPPRTDSASMPDPAAQEHTTSQTPASRAFHPFASLQRTAPEISPRVAIIDTGPDTIWDTLREQFNLADYSDHKSVKQQIKWLQRHPDYFRKRAAAFARYMPYIADELRQYGIPGELALMPVIESALDPYAYSPGGAAGLWQFIDVTAERFGLRRDYWYDGRRDVIASTDAAISYLSFLHQSFDDWLLVMAGYNAGEGTVRRALRRHGSSAHSSGKSRNVEDSVFWQLGLPRETRNYVPRILAYAAVIKDPARYDITLPDLPHTPGFDVVELPAQYDLMQVADALGVPLEDLYRLNPAFNQWATPESGPHRVIVPTHLDTEQATTDLAAIPEPKRMGWQRITVASGDTLSGLAQKHGTRVSSIRKANRLRHDRIRIGQALYIPKSSAAENYPIARLRGGATHTVASGDSLWTIARAHKVRISDLVRWNELNPKKPLRPGQQLHISATDRRVVRKVRYSVRKGDSLSRIADRFNVRTNDIVRWNSLDRGNYLKPGQKLTLHVNVAKSRANSAVGL